MILPSVTWAQHKLTFDYDAVGNQVLRQWICLNCPAGQAYQPQKKERVLTLQKEKELQGADTMGLARNLVSSPNPVEERLHVTWRTTNNYSFRYRGLFFFLLPVARNLYSPGHLQ